ncbi:hypothetical protein SBF1_4290008 [Candidatus Desulfosporosinus infrequens]|uniref:Uncharacterized protein n=1 Tax=Candidatus Desulfosporosinus infrequens TaxID=2043169 RepID=A0A2U3LBC1_9FIRM|nr:hypothetical protein SBF1_4290008 [Candidatus Desulfosporosinus infrequens]
MYKEYVKFLKTAELCYETQKAPQLQLMTALSIILFDYIWNLPAKMFQKLHEPFPFLTG